MINLQNLCFNLHDKGPEAEHASHVTRVEDDAAQADPREGGGAARLPFDVAVGEDVDARGVRSLVAIEDEPLAGAAADGERGEGVVAGARARIEQPAQNDTAVAVAYVVGCTIGSAIMAPSGRER